MTAGPSRSNMNRAWHDIPERGHRDHVSSRRQPFSPEESFDRRFNGRHFDDPYFYDDGSHGMKRSFYMTVRISFCGLKVGIWLFVLLIFKLLLLFVHPLYSLEFEVFPCF
jgi:hypothetical protein